MQKAFNIYFYRLTLLIFGLSITGYARNLYYSYTEDPQQIQLIDEGCLALYLRLKLIEDATESIEVEYFKYAPDRSGRLINQALIRKAQKGVTVRILLDYYGACKKSGFNKHYVRFLQNSGVEVRFYNPAPLFRPRKLLHRNHRKTLIIDGEHVLLGGRNQLDRFFELDPKINRFDREVYLVGSTAREIQNAFECFWDSRHTVKIGRFNPISENEFQQTKRSRNWAEVVNFFTENEKDRSLLNRIKTLGEPMLHSTPTFISDRTEYMSDTPFFKDRGQVMTHVYKILSNAQENIVIETLCFTPQKQEEEIFLDLLRSNVTISVLTNSLFVSTNRTASGIGHRRSRRLIDHGLYIYAYDGDPIFRRRNPLSLAALDATWSIHTKSVAIDNNHTLIGSCNFNPRARHYDSEHALIFYDNPEVAASVKRQFREKTVAASQLTAENRFIDKTSGKASLTFHQRVGNTISTFLMRPFISAL